MTSDSIPPSAPHVALRRVVEALNARSLNDYVFLDAGRAKQAAREDSGMKWLKWFPGRRKGVWFSHRIATPAGILFYRLEIMS